MRHPPEIKELPRFPVTGGTILLAIGVTLAYWGHKLDVAPLLEDANVRRWQLWRLVTSALPHGSVYHLAFNAYWIWVFGTLVEKIIGHLRTLAIFLLLAAGSGAAEYGILTGGIGLSGVGYGLFGMLWVLSKRDERFADAVDQNTTALFVLWFFICIGLDLSGVMPIANVAHGVGALLGVLIGYAIAGRAGARARAVTALAILCTASLACATVARPWVNLARDGGAGEIQLGIDAIRAGRNREAVRWLTDATRIEPRNAIAWYDLGVALGDAGRDVESIAAYAKAHDLSPADAGYEYAHATAAGYHALNQRRDAQAERWFDKATRLKPDQASAWYDLGIACERQEKWSQATDAFQHAVQLEPTNTDYGRALAEALSNSKGGALSNLLKQLGGDDNPRPNPTSQPAAPK